MSPVLGKVAPVDKNAFFSADRNVLPVPITSPVDFISGPKKISTVVILEKEKTGAFTVINLLSG